MFGFTINCSQIYECIKYSRQQVNINELNTLDKAEIKHISKTALVIIENGAR